MNRHVAVIAAALLAGCAVADPSSPAASASLTCTRETPTGSNIPVTRCRSPEDVRRDAEAAKDAGDAIGRSTSGIRGPTGP